MAQEEKEVRWRTYDEYITGRIPRKGEEAKDPSPMFFSMASMFLVISMILLCMIVFFPQDSFMSLFLLVLMDAISFVGFFGYIYMYLNVGKPGNEQSGPITHSCKYCGKGFSKEKVGKIHESTCVKMKL